MVLDQEIAYSRKHQGGGCHLIDCTIVRGGFFFGTCFTLEDMTTTSSNKVCLSLKSRSALFAFPFDCPI